MFHLHWKARGMLYLHSISLNKYRDPTWHIIYTERIPHNVWCMCVRWERGVGNAFGGGLVREKFISANPSISGSNFQNSQTVRAEGKNVLGGDTWDKSEFYKEKNPTIAMVRSKTPLSHLNLLLENGHINGTFAMRTALPRLVIGIIII